MKDASELQSHVETNVAMLLVPWSQCMALLRASRRHLSSVQASPSALKISTPQL